MLHSLCRADGCSRRPAPERSRGTEFLARALKRLTVDQSSPPFSGSSRPPPSLFSSFRSPGVSSRCGPSSHFLRAIGLTLAFHRYFAHRAFQMNRAARFVLGVRRYLGDAEGAAVVGRASRQPSPVCRSRRRSAQPDGQRHLLRAHRLVPERRAARSRSKPAIPSIRDFSKAPEIAWLDRYFFAIPPLLLALAMYLDRRHAVADLGLLPADDDPGACDVRHQLRSITCSVRGGSTRSTSRATTPLTAFFAVGEGWHNNHHRYQRAARNGFYWWEFDPTWYVIRADGRWSGWRGTSRRCRRGFTPKRAPPRRAAALAPSVTQHHGTWSHRPRALED